MTWVLTGSSLSANEEPILMMSHVRIATRSHDYGSKSPIDGKEVESSHSNPSTSAPIHYRSRNLIQTW